MHESNNLYLVLLGCKPPGRHTEQHDIFLGIGKSLGELAPKFKAFWPEAPRIHIDAWREIHSVDGYSIKVVPRGNGQEMAGSEKNKKLFLINLGGYQENKFEEQHYLVLTVQENKAEAGKLARDTVFFRQNQFNGALSHIDDQYGIEVDDVYEIEDLLNPEWKKQFSIVLKPEKDLAEDPFHLGYLKLSDLEV